VVGAHEGPSGPLGHVETGEGCFMTVSTGQKALLERLRGWWREGPSAHPVNTGLRTWEGGPNHFQGVRGLFRGRRTRCGPRKAEKSGAANDPGPSEGG